MFYHAFDFSEPDWVITLRYRQHHRHLHLRVFVWFHVFNALSLALTSSVNLSAPVTFSVFRDVFRNNGSRPVFVKPPPPVGAGGGYMFSGHPSVRASVRDSRGSFMFPRYLQYLLTDFRQTFVTGASRDRDELIRFWGQSSRSQHDRIHPRFLCFRDISSIYW